MRLRTVGAQILVDAAIAERVPVYVHGSVSFVYADAGTAWLSEDGPIDDGDVAILRATLEGEQQATRFTQAGGRGIVLRFGGVVSGRPSAFHFGRPPLRRATLRWPKARSMNQTRGAELKPAMS